MQDILNQCYLSIKSLTNYINEIIKKCKSYNSESKKLLNVFFPSSIIEDNPSVLFLSKPKNQQFKLKTYEKLVKDYSYLKESFVFLEELLRVIAFNNNEAFIQLHILILKADEYQKAINLLNNQIYLLKNGLVRSNGLKDQCIRNINKKKPKAKIIVKESNCLRGTFKSEINCEPISAESLVQSEDALCASASASSFLEIETFEINKKIVNHIEYESIITEEISLENSFNAADSEQSINNLIKKLEEEQSEFESWKYKKNLQLLELFNVIESSTLVILCNGSNAFLKILSYYHQELITKSTDLTLQKEKIMYFIEVAALESFLKCLIVQGQWLDETQKRIVSCIDRVKNSFQSSENLTDISPRALLTEYLKLTINSKNSQKLLIAEEEKLTLLYSNFTKQVLPANSLQQVQEKVNVTELSKQVDKVNQLKISIELGHINKQKILNKLRSIAPDQVKHIYQIDPLHEMNAESHIKNLEIASVSSEVAVPFISQQLAECVTFYSPALVVYTAVQPSNQLFYSM